MSKNNMEYFVVIYFIVLFTIGKYFQLKAEKYLKEKFKKQKLKMFSLGVFKGREYYEEKGWRYKKIFLFVIIFGSIILTIILAVNPP